MSNYRFNTPLFVSRYWASKARVHIDWDLFDEPFAALSSYRFPSAEQAERFGYSWALRSNFNFENVIDVTLADLLDPSAIDDNLFYWSCQTTPDNPDDHWVFLSRCSVNRMIHVLFEAWRPRVSRPYRGPYPSPAQDNECAPSPIHGQVILAYQGGTDYLHILNSGHADRIEQFQKNLLHTDGMLNVCAGQESRPGFISELELQELREVY